MQSNLPFFPWRTTAHYSLLECLFIEATRSERADVALRLARKLPPSYTSIDLAFDQPALLGAFAWCFARGGALADEMVRLLAVHDVLAPGDLFPSVNFAESTFFQGTLCAALTATENALYELATNLIVLTVRYGHPSETLKALVCASCERLLYGLDASTLKNTPTHSDSNQIRTLIDGILGELCGRAPFATVIVTLYEIAFTRCGQQCRGAFSGFAEHCPSAVIALAHRSLAGTISLPNHSKADLSKITSELIGAAVTEQAPVS